MFTLLAVGSLWAWILFIVASIIIIACLENDSGTGATITMIATIVLLTIFGGKDDLASLWAWCSSKPLAAIGLFMSYIVVGFVWSFVKWYFYLISFRDQGFNRRDAHLEVDYNKGRLIAWATYWPFSVIWTFIDQPVKRIITYIFNRLTGIYDSILNRVFPVESQSIEK